MRNSDDMLPLWRKILIELEEGIGKGRFAPGEKLPTEAALAAHFGANRHTIRRAIARLQERGIVRSEQGRGSFVQEQMLVHRMNSRARLSRTSEIRGKQSGRMVLGAGRVRATRHVARAFGINIGTLVERVETLRLVDDRPVSVTTHFYPLPRFEGIGDRIAEQGSVTSALKAFGVDELRHVESRISAKMPNQKDAKHLRQPMTRPVLQSVNYSVDPDGSPVQLSIARFVASAVELTVHYDLAHTAP
ncbi:phosphonate metabolism transcriptional regulator PhnF [Rhizobium miluonense]|uniref:GntR family transcriptional regulator, phosphonate transport system regulatory protein n=1 Tax=Rhizobium miluonense TaxID=411945 RepID=A0A1C3WDH3_9HYPH|nr:GntR family transcriptional regulator, phosphonate transport system regulatory protein [Rhizobium miluonense]